MSSGGRLGHSRRRFRLQPRGFLFVIVDYVRGFSEINKDLCYDERIPSIP